MNTAANGVQKRVRDAISDPMTHKLSKLAQRYKLSEAGLHQTPKKRYQNRVKEFWLRPGWRLETVNGKKPKLFNEGLQLEKLLEDDAGYIAEFRIFPREN